MLFALTIFIISVLASRDNVLEKVDLAEEYQGILGLLASPEISAATEALAKIKELVQTSSSSKVEIGERQRGIGFSSLQITTAAADTVYRKIEPMIEELTEFIETLPVNTQLKTSATKLVSRLSAGLVESGSRSEVIVSFTGIAQSGKIDLSYMIFGITPTDKFRCSTFRVSGSFSVAPDWYIKTTSSSKKGFFKSKETSTQEIVYVDRGITQADIGELLLVSIPDFRIAKNLLPNA